MTETDVLDQLKERYRTSNSNLSFNEYIMTKKTKAIIIDPFTRSVTQTELDGSLDDIYQKIGNGCELFEMIHVDAFTDLYVDEEGLLSGHASEGEEKFGFMLTMWNRPIWGRAIVVGRDMKGQNKSTNLSPDGVRAMLRNWVQGR